MNARQLEIFIRQSFQAERWARQIIDEAQPAFIQAMAEVRRIVGQLPDETLLREVEWRRRYLPLVEDAIRPFNDALAKAVVDKMVDVGPEIEAEALASLRAVGAIPITPLAPTLGQPIPAFTRMALQSEVVQGTSLLRLFGYDPNGGPPQTTPPFTRSNLRIINQKVSAGILAGEPTSQIADKIARVVPSPGVRRLRINERGTVAHESNAWAEAIARTGIQDMNRQVNEQVWRDNPLSGDQWGYEWVSAMDPRVCPACAPLDGKVRDKRTKFPQWPLHFNCRCQVVLINKNEREDVRFGVEVSDEEYKYRGTPISELRGEERREALGRGGYYASKVKVRGKKMNGRVKEFEARPNQRRVTYGDYLNQSDRQTQAMFFGGGPGGEKRAADFRAWVKSGKTPQQAMAKTIINMPGPASGPIKDVNAAKVRLRPLKQLTYPAEK